MAKEKRIEIISPEGEWGTIPEANLEEMSRYGYRVPTAEEIQAREDKKHYTSAPEALKAGLEGTARGLTAGLSDVAQTQLGISDPEDMRKREQYNSELALGTELTGAIVPLLLSGGTSGAVSGAAKAGRLAKAAAGVKAAGAVPRGVAAGGQAVERAILKAALSRGAGHAAAKKIAAKGVGGAVEGAAFGVGQTVSDLALERIQTEDLSESFLTNAGLGAVLGGAIPVATGGLGAGAKWASKTKPGRSIAKSLAERFPSENPSLLGRTAEHLEQLSYERATKQLGPKKGQMKKLLAREGKNNTGAEKLGKWLREKRLIEGEEKSVIGGWELATNDRMRKRLEAIRTQAGKQIEKITDDNNLARVNVASMTRKMREKVLEPLRASTAAGDHNIARRVEKEIKNIERKFAGDTGVMHKATIKENEDIKRSFDKFLKFNAEPTPVQSSLEDLRRIVKEHTEDTLSKVESSIANKGDWEAKTFEEMRTKDVLKEFRKAKNDYKHARTALEIVDDHIAADKVNRSISLTDYITGGSMGGIGGMTGAGLATGGAIAGGLPGMVAGVAANKAMREFGNQGLSSISAVAADALKFMDGVKIESQIARQIGSWISTAPKRTATTSAGVSILHELNYGDEPSSKTESPGEAFRARYGEIAKAVDQPEITIDRLVDATAGLQDIAPVTAQKVRERVLGMLAYLKDRAPKQQSPSGYYQWEPSPAELGPWVRIVRALEKPLSVLDDLESGRVNVEGAEVLRRFFPQTYSMMQAEIVKQLGDLTEPLPYQKRVAIESMFELPVDETTTPEFSRWATGATPEPEQPEPKRQRTSTGIKIDSDELTQNTTTQIGRLLDGRPGE